MKKELKLKASEKKWIAQLKSLMKKCPSRFWFFSNGSLHIMVVDEDGHQVFTKTGSIDQNYCVDGIVDRLFEGGGF